MDRPFGGLGRHDVEVALDEQRRASGVAALDPGNDAGPARRRFDGDRPKAAELAQATQRLATISPDNRDMTAAAEHASGLLDRDPAVLERAAERYAPGPARASALEDAGRCWAEQGNESQAVVRLGQAHTLYRQLDDADGMARVRYRLRSAGVRLRHWAYEDRPAFGWDSLTETERRITGLVAEGLSNRQVANRVFLSPHTVAFHLRHIFWKLGITSRVQLARIAAEQGTGDAAGDAPS
jgi:DNA-binding CsgD family transcriptional regulator